MRARKQLSGPTHSLNIDLSANANFGLRQGYAHDFIKLQKAKFPYIDIQPYSFNIGGANFINKQGI